MIPEPVERVVPEPFAHNSVDKVLHFQYNESMKIRAQKSNLSGHIQVPGSKSHTIRALLLAALAEGTSYVRNILNTAMKNAGKKC